jgi:hypothetical protein
MGELRAVWGCLPDVRTLWITALTYRGYYPS